MTDKLTGVISPNLTPFNEDYSVAEDLYVRHAHWLLDQGCSVITPFGTTGEALSIGLSERKHLLEKLIQSGMSPDRLMVGTGLTNLPDTIDLSRHAMAEGCRGVMVLPPFYIKGVSDEGLYQYFKTLIEAAPELRIFLYHIPPMAVIGFSLDLVNRLAQDFPEQIVGLKDSGGDFSNTRSLLEMLPHLSIFPGTETALLATLRLGGAGCITATANIHSAAINHLYQTWEQEGADDRDEQIRQFREMVQPYGPIPAMKWLLADATGDSRWRIVRPPLESLDDHRGQELKASLRDTFGFELTWG